MGVISAPSDGVGTTVGIEYRPKSSTPQYQLSAPAYANRSRTADALSASGRRYFSTRLDSDGLSSTRPWMNGARAGVIGAAMKAP